MLLDLVYLPDPRTQDFLPTLEQIQAARHWFIMETAKEPDRIVFPHLDGGKIFGMEIVV